MDITEPTLLLNKQITEQNIARMVQQATVGGVELKPHVKTHQSVAIGGWMLSYGISKITVSSVGMAEYFAQAGWNDITIAFPCNPLLYKRLNELGRRIELSILISDSAVLSLLENSLTAQINVYIEIDTGANRSGFYPSQLKKIQFLVNQLAQSEHLTFKGFYSHPGHSYSCRSKKQIRVVHHDVLDKMQQLKNHFNPISPDLVVCIGDTPCCSVGQNFKGIDEISPGNFVFYDLMQVQIGSCTPADIAVALACPVVAKFADRHEIIVHAGAVHLSKEQITDDNHTCYGNVVVLDEELRWYNPLGECYVKSLSQEHGVIHCSASFFKKTEVGDIIGILPVHSCLTANEMRSYYLTEKNTFLDHLEMTNG